MPYQVSDIFIGTFPITQGFDERPQFYNARFGIKSHNGTDWGCPKMTPILSAANGYVSEKGFDTNGYGNYLKIVHGDFLTLYGHLNDIAVNLNDRVVAGQLIGHSDTTGLADGPHLHFGLAPCDQNGNKTEINNGWSGYINPLGDRVEWNVKNLTAPVVQSSTDNPPVAVPADIYPHIISEGTNWITIATYAVGHGVNEYLQANTQAIIDMQNNKSDPEGGKKVVNYMTYLLQRINDLESVKAVAPVAGITTVQSQGVLEGVKQLLEKFIYKQ